MTAVLCVYFGGMLPFAIASYSWWPWEPHRPATRFVGAFVQAPLWPLAFIIWLAGWVDDDQENTTPDSGSDPSSVGRSEP